MNNNSNKNNKKPILGEEAMTPSQGSNGGMGANLVTLTLAVLANIQIDKMRFSRNKIPDERQIMSLALWPTMVLLFLTNLY